MKKNTKKIDFVKVSDYALMISVLLYVAACFFPTGVTFGSNHAKGGYGIVCLLLGWLGIYGEYILLVGAWTQVDEDKWQFILTTLLTAPTILWTWISNFLYFRAMIDLFRERKARRSLILCAAAFASSLAFIIIYCPLRFHRLPFVGSFIWMASYLSALVAAIAFWLSRPSVEKRPAIAPIRETERQEDHQPVLNTMQKTDEQPTLTIIRNTWKEKKKDKWLMASLILFGLACICPMVTRSYEDFGYPGFAVLILGWIGVLVSQNMILIWLTSFLYYASLWFAFSKPASSPVPVILALMSFLSTVIVLLVLFIDSNHNNEVFHIGYYFWMASTFTLLIRAVRCWWNTK